MDITIRRAEPSDGVALKEVYEGIEAYSNTLQLPYPALSIWEQRVSNIPDSLHVFVALVDEEVVGSLGFELCSNLRRRHVGSFGMGVKDAYAGKGIGRALLSAVIDFSDNWLNLKRIELTVFKDNIRAISLYQSFGFQIEGESPDFAYRNGSYVTAYHMARLKK